MRPLQIVMGPAGCGKSSYCHMLQQYCAGIGRQVHVVNLDPAAEVFEYDVAADIRDLVSLEDVVEELNYGPNGGLVYCMEYLVDNMDWLQEELDSFHEDDYVVFDCPGQIELYTHYPVMTTIVRELQRLNFSICALYLIDSTFCQDTTKFLSASLTALSTMVMLEVAHINVLTKCDLVPGWDENPEFEKFTRMDLLSLTTGLEHRTPRRHQRLTRAIGDLMEDWSMVAFVPLDRNNEDTITLLLHQVDHAIQYGEDAEVKVRDIEPNDPDHDEHDDE